MSRPTGTRCAAAHAEDVSRCVGPTDAVRIVDQATAEVLGCVRHGAILLASLDGGRVYVGPGGRAGTAIEVDQDAQHMIPFAFERAVERGEPGLLPPEAMPRVARLTDFVRAAEGTASAILTHPAWCDVPTCTAADRAGTHRSAVRTINPRRVDGDGLRLDVTLDQPELPPTYPSRASVHIEAHRDAYPDDEPAVLILSQRQAYLLARAVDALLLSAWYPSETRPVLLGRSPGGQR